LKDNVVATARSFGELLLPTIKSMVQWATALAQRLAGMNDRTKTTILRIAAVAAAIGPLVLILGKFLILIPQLQAGWAALNASFLASPIGLIALGIAGLTAGIIALIRVTDQEARKERELTELKRGLITARAEERKVILETVVAKRKEMVADHEAMAQRMRDSIEETRAKIEQYGDVRGALSKTIALTQRQLDKDEERAARQRTLLEEEQAQLDAVNKELEETNKRLGDLANIAGIDEVALAAVNSEIERMREELRKLRDGEKEGTEGVVETVVKLTEEQRRAKAATVARARAALIAANEESMAWQETTNLDIEGIEKRRDNYKHYTELIDESHTNTTRKVIKEVKEMAGAYVHYTDLIEAAWLDTNREMAIVTTTTAEETAETTEEMIRRIVSEYRLLANEISQIFTSISSLIEARYDREIELLDRNLQQQIDALDQQAMGEQAYADEVLRLTEEFEDERAQLHYEGAIKAWRLEVGAALVSGAQAILNGLLTKPFIPAGIIAGALAATLAGIQIATIKAQKPLPPLAQGGIVPATAGGQPIIAGEGGMAEAVVPLDRIGEFISNLPAATIDGGSTRVIVNLDGQPILDAVAEGTRTRDLVIDSRAVV
jgi:hypothetical protein